MTHHNVRSKPSRGFLEILKNTLLLNFNDFLTCIKPSISHILLLKNNADVP